MIVSKDTSHLNCLGFPRERSLRLSLIQPKGGPSIWTYIQPLSCCTPIHLSLVQYGQAHRNAFIISLLNFGIYFQPNHAKDRKYNPVPKLCRGVQTLLRSSNLCNTSRPQEYLPFTCVISQINSKVKKKVICCLNASEFLSRRISLIFHKFSQLQSKAYTT